MRDAATAQQEGAPCCVRVAVDERRGRVLLATQPLAAGQVVVREKPLILVRPRDPSLPPSRFLHGMHEQQLLMEFLSKPLDVRQKILDFHSPTDGPLAEEMRTVLLRIIQSQRQQLPVKVFENIVLEQIDLVVKVAMVFNFNAVSVNPATKEGKEGATLGSGLYATACRASHSCRPNCTWYADADGERVVRALVPVAAGEEVTIDYCMDRMDTNPTHERRSKLLSGWGFLCECPRCSAIGDDTRRTPCEGLSTCTGHHFVHQPSQEDTPTLTPCSECGSRAPLGSAERTVEREMALSRHIQSINRAMDLGFVDPSILRRLLGLEAPHRHHYLAAEVAWLQYELHNNQLDHRLAASALLRLVECRNAILGALPSRATAFKWEFCGDRLLAASSPAEAREAHAQAVRLLLLFYGPSHPFSACAAKKLLGSFSRLPSLAADSSGRALDQCAFCGRTESFNDLLGGGGLLSRCGRCAGVAYCCREHQKHHWKIHKKACPVPGTTH